ncbi:tyrosine-protein phosphatase [Nocardia brasiliensis]|uniref:tyrosine-protein phosphatase n=1 Tax=Nocardia brasiliensis TaxID=37326 RepID=UPI0004A77386|nr:tyrosine-protein phosphatase [Nocardia brasiliensis]MBF6124154.1 tyrosine-protein phosphatase [Nocardia brasiliensis]MBF6543967.1 tyrosine-protein phosphatase [Nocardia brasiliensis]
MTLSPPADQYFISGTFNFRDLGGLRTLDGAKVRPGVLLRSAQLTGLDEAGLAALRDLRVSDVHDLRGEREIDHIGHDRVPEDVRVTVTPFDSRMAEAPPHHATPDSAFRHMLEVYRMFPALPEAHAAITAIAESIVRGDGAVLVHCAAGKDRTGWAVATLLRAVGVTEADVQADYRLSNGAIPALRAMMTTKLLAGEELSVDLLGVRDEYLNIATNSMHELHGDVDTYLTTAGITPELRTRLRDRMLE